MLAEKRRVMTGRVEADALVNLLKTVKTAVVTGLYCMVPNSGVPACLSQKRQRIHGYASECCTLFGNFTNFYGMFSFVSTTLNQQSFLSF